MKILFITHKFYPFIGGIEVNSEILAKAFQNAGHEIKLITTTIETGEKKFPFEVIRNPDFKLLISVHKWAEVVFENNPSLNLSWPNLFFSTPRVIALRTWIAREDGRLALKDKFKKHWLKNAAGVIAVSEAVRRKTWLPAIVIGNPYRYDSFKILPTVKRDKQFVFLGRLVSDKGADLAIKAIKILSEKYSDLFADKGLRLTIIGDGDQKEMLRLLVQKLKLETIVDFVGPLSGLTLINCLNEHKYLLVPSVWEEPFGNVALEGIACGCLPFVSDGGGLPDAVGNAGIVFKRGSEEEIVKAIVMVLKDPSLENNIRAAAKAHLTNHHPDVVSRRYLDVIEKAHLRV